MPFRRVINDHTAWCVGKLIDRNVDYQSVPLKPYMG